ncbi:hypothetical protein BJ170DRAFT_676242 [Xylariales sp. AK1849]|nr:hypothetical protein BJ170DRAFT_676242 [Xylariales sp. AK1849]
MSAQRTAELEKHFSGSDQELRPILTSLNGDNSWLFSFPRPVAERTSSGKAYFHIVSDPWLAGPAVTFSSWLVHLNLPAPPFVDGGKGVEELVREIEDIAAASGIVPRSTKEGSSLVDAIFLNFHYADHMHKDTLLTFDPNIPVVAALEADREIRKWNHFTNVTTQHDLEPGNGNWRNLHPGTQLPEWLTVFRCVGHHELNFMTAIVWSSGEDKHEALVYSPHCILVDQPSAQTFAHDLSPPVSTMAMLFALHDSYALHKRTTFGVDGGLAMERAIKPKYWVRTHDSALVYKGILVRLLVTEVVRTIESALAKEKKSGKGDELQKVPNYVEVENGTCFVLA